MKNLKTLLVIALTMMAGLQAQAQKMHGQKGKPVKTTTKKEAEAPLHRMFLTMLPSTAKVMFIDSVVVSKADFLSRISLPHELGQLSSKGSIESGEVLGQYENDFGDRRFYATGDTLGTHLVSQILLGETWSNPTRQAGIDEKEFMFQNFPFLCSDGFTLFFSAQGPNSLGGRDIFMTIYDTDKGEWYEPQNYGLPFNSTANDYLLAIDDLDSLGWLVSDRFQPQDSVCIYTFVPTNPRLDFANDNLSDLQLQHYAKLQSIKSTWKFGKLTAALKRRDAMLQRNTIESNTDGFQVVVDDRKILTAKSSFASEDSHKLFKQSQELHELLAQSRASLSSKRLSYQTADAAEKARLRDEILNLEKNVIQQRKDIITVEKKIRNIEVSR